MQHWNSPLSFLHDKYCLIVKKWRNHLSGCCFVFVGCSGSSSSSSSSNSSNSSNRQRLEQQWKERKIFWLGMSRWETVKAKIKEGSSLKRFHTGPFFVELQLLLPTRWRHRCNFADTMTSSVHLNFAAMWSSRTLSNQCLLKYSFKAWGAKV